MRVLPSLASSIPSSSSSLSLATVSLGAISKMMPRATLPSITSALPPCSRSSASSFVVSLGSVVLR